MTCFIFGNTEIVLGFGCSICLGIANQNLLQTLHGLFKVVKIEFRFPLAKNELGSKILWRQKTDEPVVLIAIQVHDDDRWSPFDTVPFDQSLALIEVNLEGNEILLYRSTDIRIGVSNSCQLLAPNSEIVIKVHQNQFFPLLCLCFGRCERSLPLNLFSHNKSSFHDDGLQNC